MSTWLDAGALIAIDRRDRRVGAMLRVLQRAGEPVWTTEPVVAQVWRDGRKQANLARALTGIGVRPLGGGEGRRVGELQGRADADDVVDAHLVLSLRHDDLVLTSDPEDIRHLLERTGIRAGISRV